jgi:hypothetical protein
MSDFQQVVRWLQSGKKVRRKIWGAESYIYGREGIIRYQNGERAYFCITHFTADDWEIYEEESLSSKIIKIMDAKVENNLFQGIVEEEVISVKNIIKWAGKWRDKIRKWDVEPCCHGIMQDELLLEFDKSLGGRLWQ